MRLFYKICAILFLLNVLLEENVNSEEQENGNAVPGDDTFIPTREWQVVKKGQKLPKGLHVRVNFETGLTEAKLIDKRDEHSALVEITSESESASTSKESDNFLSPLEVKKALNKIKSDENDLDPERVKNIKQRFRNYEQLKKELGDLSLTPKTDAQILKELIRKHEKILTSKSIDFKKETEILQILEDINYLVHQYDNANEFVAIGGYQKIIYKNLNSSNAEIKRESLKLIGTSCQNNGNVQIHALETGSIDIVLRLLALETDNGVKNRAVFALSGLLRRFPLAQLKFVENAGLSVFSNIFQKSENSKIQVKIVTLINDLLLEHQEAIFDHQNSQFQVKLEQYSLVDLKSKLVQHNWCENVSKLFLELLTIDQYDHDSLERCLLAIKSTTRQCSQHFGENLRGVLVKLNSRYEKLAFLEKESEDNMVSSGDYYTKLCNLCTSILNDINVRYVDEL